MSEKDIGGPAFPQYDYGNAGKGMSLRDWFAGQALPTLGRLSSPNDLARNAYKIADAMLKARASS